MDSEQPRNSMGGGVNAEDGVSVSIIHLLGGLIRSSGARIDPNPPESEPRPNPSESAIRFCGV